MNAIVKSYLAFAASLVLSSSQLMAILSIPEDAKTGGWAVGVQAWTFKSFTLMEAIQKTAETGAKAIELFPNQKMASDSGAKFDHNATPDMIEKVKAHLQKFNVHAVNYGVVGGKGEAEWRKIFEFAKTMKLHAITTEAVDQLDIIEKLAKEYDIPVGIHHHFIRSDRPDYKLWDPNYILSLIKSRDRLIGATADTGHWATSNVKPIDALRILKGRIISVHMKDRSEIGKASKDVPFGAGVLDLKGVMDELKAQGFKGNVSIEWEHNWENSVPEVAQCVGFFRGYATCK